MKGVLLTHVLAGEQAMLGLGETWGRNCAQSPAQGLFIYLRGPLGAGKTTLARGFLRGFGHQGAVKSPTYTLVETYDFLTCSVFHFDFYRIQHADELEYIGIKDFFHHNAICLIEWAELAEGLLPPADLSCEIQFCRAGREREIQLQAHSARGHAILKCNQA